jgi:hypothetical protein
MFAPGRSKEAVDGESNRVGGEVFSQMQVCDVIQDIISILVHLRALAGELVFTAAAFYGLYHAFQFLAR